MDKILVVDDDKDILEPLSLILENSGYIVETIAKGKQVYEKVDKFHPDAILLDILMSGSDGRTICKHLKLNPKTKQIRVIMMSAHPGADKDSLDVGADDFLAKPFETEELLAIVKKNVFRK